MLELQHFYIAYDGTYFSPDIVKISPSSIFVTIFLNIGKNKYGFVAPHTGMVIDFGNIHEALPKLKNELVAKYNFKGIENIEIHQMLKTFVLFVSKAYRHKLEKRYDEAFLHFIITLDLLFGDKSASTKSIAKRVAILTHRQMAVDYKQQKKKLEKLYDIRSRYVHAGQSVNKTELELAHTLSRLVISCILNLQKKRKHVSLRFLKVLFASWIICQQQLRQTSPFEMKITIVLER